MTKIGDVVAGGFTAIVGAIYQQGVEQSLPWIVAMTCVVFADLAMGIRRSWLMGDDIRWSRGVRATLSKLVSYLAFVVGAVMVDVASHSQYDIAKWSCLFVCVVEGCSIVENIIAPHGYTLNLQALVRAIGKKANVDTDGILKKSKKKVD